MSVVRALAWLFVAAGVLLSLAVLLLVTAVALPILGLEATFVLWALFPLTFALGPVVILVRGETLPFTLWLVSVACFATAGFLYRRSGGDAGEPIPLSRGAETDDEVRLARR